MRQTIRKERKEKDLTGIRTGAFLFLSLNPPFLVPCSVVFRGPVLSCFPQTVNDDLFLHIELGLSSTL